MEDNDSVNDGYVVKPVYKAIQVLQRLANKREASLAEISRSVGLPKTTVFRYLYTLRECGLVSHDPDKDRYSLGLYAWELGRLAGGQLPVREVALPHMVRLRDTFDETVNLGVLQGKEIVYLEIVESRRALRMQAQLGGHDTVYSTSIGKALLAFLPEAQLRKHLPSRLISRTPNTVTSVSALKEELARTRQRGYSEDRGENEDGARCIGAPVFDERGRVLAAISISAPATRLRDEMVPTIASSIVATATTISRELGYVTRNEPVAVELEGSVPKDSA